ALNNVGEVYYNLGELRQSLDYYRQAQRLWEELGDRRGLAITQLNFGYTYSDQGNAPEALDSFTQALAAWEAVNDHRGQALTLTALGRFYSRTGESQKSLEFFARSKDLIHLIGDPIEEARTLNGIAYVYEGLGEGKRALEHYEHALQLFKAAKYLNGEATTLGELGKAYQFLGENDKAFAYHQQAMSIFRAVGNPRMEMVQLKEIGIIYESRGNRTTALKNYLVAHAFYRAQRDLRGEAVILNLIGSIYEHLGQSERALGYYSGALRASQESKYRFAEASTLFNIARLERDRGKLPEARARIEAALSVVESIRTKVASQDLRASYFAGVRQYYQLHIDTLMQAHKQRPTEGLAEAAFDISEKARARSLLELLNEARAKIRQGVDPALLDQERSLQQALNSKAERQVQLIAGRQKEEAEIVGRELDQLVMQYEEIAARIRSSSPRYADLMQPQPMNLKAVQQMLTDDNTLLLEYMLGDDRSYLWAVTRNEVSSYELAGRHTIERAAQGVYDLLTANRSVEGETFQEHQARLVKANDSLPIEIATLSKLILGPVAHKLEKQRLLIVPDGALQYIPFQILTKSSSGPSPLVADHEIVNEPSASTLGLLITGAAKRKPASGSVAVLADPVFELDDPRMRSTAAANVAAMPATAPQTELQNTLRDVGVAGTGRQIPRLPASRAEADAIISVAPWRSGFKALGFEASRATAMRRDLGDYRFVHFATHGVLNNKHPELSGIVLSLFDHNGQPQEGFLRLHDIYNLELPVDLVVLSACDTGLGKDVKGEGLIGLTRGFMYAGAASVVASLWKVDDDATAELMRNFYGFMLQDGLAPAAALRKAQLTLSQNKRWQSPYYWSGFIIQGQYTQNPQPKRFSRTALLWVSVAAGVGIVAIFALWRRRIRTH
ncbi:MAG: CHAT domain-containing tetratricopeptide repeat protein, partial [Pyrinomonadaceae bacterium]